jgi:uncharacterized phage protein (TIGR01671 family)
MRIIHKITNKIEYSNQEYHRLMYNHYCNPLTNKLLAYEFDKPSGVFDVKGIEIYENDIVSTEFYLHNQKNLKLTQVVKFEKGCFVLKPLVARDDLEFESTYQYTNLYVADKVEVIDNIHHNRNEFELKL